MPQSVNIRPGVSMLSVLRHLNYKPWYALAEFVDNSIQSYKDKAADISAVDGETSALRVGITLGSELDPRMTVRDNAGGIAATDYSRAFKAAELPLDRTGLSEFGMGMKSAACWFARRWQVRSAALGEGIEKTIRFDIGSIVTSGTENLNVSARPIDPRSHFTEILLEELYKPPQGRTRSKIRDHLSSIYRIFLRSGFLELELDGEILSYSSPRILVAAPYNQTEAPPVEWRKQIDFDFGDGLSAKGFAALRERGSTSDAGFALFRRDRLIEGSGEEGYRPQRIFGRPNSFRSQRLFGELELKGFSVSHTKDGFQWDENEDAFLDLLREELNAQPLPLLDQAEEYRSLRSREELAAGAESATSNTASALQAAGSEVVDRLVESPPEEMAPASLREMPLVSHREVTLRFREEEWTITLETTADPAVSDWIYVSDDNAAHRRISVRLSLAHPFMQRWGGSTASEIEPFLRIAAAFGLAEIAAHRAGVRRVGTVRRNMNELLSEALSRP